MRYFLTTPELEQDAVLSLRGLGSQARRLLAACVEKQELTRKVASAAALGLEAAGFVRIRDNAIEQTVTISPTFEGEEVLEVLDQVDSETPLASAGATTPGQRRTP